MPPIFGFGEDKEKEKSQEENKQLNRELNRKDTDVKLSEREINHLKEKLEDAKKEIEEKNAEITELKVKLEIAEDTIRRLERDSTEQMFEGRIAKTEASNVKETLNDKKQKLQLVKKDLRDAHKLVQDTEKEKQAYSIEAAKMDMKLQLMEKERDREAETRREQADLFLKLKKSDDHNMEMLGKAMAKALTFAEGASRALPPAGGSSIRREALSANRRPVNNSNNPSKLPRRISIVFLEKDNSCVHEQFHIRPKEGDDLESFMDEVFDKHRHLSSAIRFRSRQSSLEALQGAGYSIKVLDPDGQDWVDIESFDDVMDFTEDHTDMRQNLTFYIVYDDEKELRLEEVLSH